MKTVTLLFKQRVVSEWKYQIEVWNTVVDWVVALYIVIPFLGIFFYEYFGWWKNIPGWINRMPLNLFLSIIILFAWSGTMRIFVQEADQLFLLQQKTWIGKIKSYSLGYSTLINLLTTSIVVLVGAPFLVKYYGFSLREFVWLWLFAFIFKTVIGIIKQFAAYRFKGLLHRFIQIVLLIITGTYFRQSIILLINSRSLEFYLCVIVLLTFLILLLPARVNIKGMFFEDVSREQDAKLKIANVFLQMNGDFIKKTKVSRKRPLLFRKSNLIFKERNPVNGLVELSLKAVLRSNKNLMFYFQMIGGCLLMIIVAPPIWKLVLWVIFLIILIFIVWMFWQETVTSPFVSMFSLRPETKLAAATKSVFLMALPGQLILSLVVILLINKGLNALLLLPIGVFISYYSAKTISLFKS